MKIDKKIIVSIAAVTILLAAIAIVYAVPSDDKIPSTKTAVAGTETIILPPEGYTDEGPEDYEDMIVAQTWIKSGNKQLVLSFSSEAILYTKTWVKETDDVTARSTIQVWAEVDGNRDCTFPRSVTFADRMQNMKSKLNETEWVELSLGTTNANAFNFLALDIDKTQGHVHNVTIHARIVSATDGDVAEAWGALGNRTLVVNEVHLKEDSTNLEYIEE